MGDQPVSLQKNQTISLAKVAAQPLTDITMGLAWTPEGRALDLDASCAVFNAQKRLIDTIWFRQLRSNDRAIQHTGDNLDGEGEGDDEKIIVALNRVSADAQTLVFTVNSFRGQTFEQIKSAYVRLIDNKTDREIARYELRAKGPHTGLIMAKVSRKGGEWELTAIGESAGGRTVNDLVPTIQKYL